MKTQIRYSYTESQIPKGCRKPRNVRLHDTVEATVREITADQAPIAIVAKFDELGMPQEVPYRWFEGKLWTSMQMYAARPRGYTSRQDDWDHRKLPDQLDLSDEASRSSGYYFGLDAPWGCPRDEAIQVIESQLADHLLIDGVPHRVATEPRYVVMTFGLSGNHGGTSIHVTDYFNDNIKAESYFSLLETKQALAYATNVAKERGDTESLPIKIEEQFEVRIKEAIQCGRSDHPEPPMPMAGVATVNHSFAI